MKLIIMEKNGMSVVAGKVVDVRYGTGAAEGRVVNVKIEGTVWNKEQSVEETKTLDIAFWNSENKPLANRITKARVKVGSLISALVILKEDNKAHGIDFKYTGIWHFPADENAKEMNVIIGTIVGLDIDEQGRYAKASVPIKDRNGETKWHKVTFWNSEEAAMADRAQACLSPRDNSKAQAVLVCGANVPYNDQPSYTGFRFELF